MTATVRGVRCIEIELANPERAAGFYGDVWHLTETAREDGSIYFRGTGRYNHILVLHRGPGVRLRRVTFDAADRNAVDALHAQSTPLAARIERPHPLNSAGGGYGFGFADPRGCNFAVVTGVDDHADAADIKDRPRKIAHVNINTPDLDASAQFMTEALGFRIVDKTGALWFFHCDNTDHNSIVMGPARGSTLNHVAFEMPDLDSTMRGAGRMRDHGYPIEWGVGRHGAGNNVFAYFAGPEEFPLEYTGEVLQIDDTYQPHGPDYWKWPPGRLDQWGVTPPHTARWKRIQDMVGFTPDGWRL